MKQSHISNRVSPLLGRTHLKRNRKGFTLPELAAALMVFAVVASIVSLSVAHSLIAQGATKDIRAANSQITSYINQVASTPFEQLADPAFSVPQEYDAITLGSKNVNLTWNITPTVKRAGNSSFFTSDITITALTAEGSIPNAAPIERRKVIKSPYAGWNLDDGSVRITQSGTYQGSLYLLDAANQVVSSGSFGDSKTLMLGTGGADCSGCRVTLDPNGNLYNQSHSFTINTLKNEGNKVSASQGKVSDVFVNIEKRTPLNVKVSSRQTVETTTLPNDNSVCLWSTFNGFSFPACNSRDNIKFDTFNFNGQNLALTESAKISLTVDNPTGGCALINTETPLISKAHDGNNWVDSPVCTSWTWGLPEHLLVNGNVQSFNGSTVKPDQELMAVWDGPQSTPANGVSDHPSWSKPRNLNSRPGGDVNFKVAYGQTLVEESNPATPYFFSNANFAPDVISPIKGVGAVVAVDLTGNSTAFTLGLRDVEGGAFNAKIRTPPSEGTLRGPGGDLTANSTLGTFTGTGNVNFTYINTNANAAVSFQVELTDSAGRVSITNVFLQRSPGASLISGNKVDLTQGQSDGKISVFFLSRTGEAMANTPVTVSNLPQGLTLNSSNLVTNAKGELEISFNTRSAVAGNYPINFTIGSTALVLNISIEPEIGTVETSRTPDTITLTIKDATGQPFNGLVHLSLTDSSGAKTKTSSCMVNDGTCLMPLLESYSGTVDLTVSGKNEIREITAGAL